jgi:biopolymer transport protein ExbD
MDFVRARKPSLSLDMAPLIDIVFQLLIFFMLSSSFLNPSLKLTLPQSEQHDQKEAERLILSIDKAGTFFVNKAKIEKTELKMVLEQNLSKDPKRAVHVRGDKDMPYQLFVQAMDIARQAGAKQINIVHESGPAS